MPRRGNWPKPMVGPRESEAFLRDAQRRARLYYEERNERTKAKEEKRHAARGAMLRQQKERERNGFYEGAPSVALALAHTMRGRLRRRIRRDETGPRKGTNLIRLR